MLIASTGMGAYLKRKSIARIPNVIPTVVSDPLREYGNEQDARRVSPSTCYFELVQSFSFLQSLYGFGDKIARARGCYTVVTDPRTGKSTQIPAPDLIVVVLPEHAAELRKVVKNWGDVSTGIPTQCVVSSCRIK